MTVAATESNRSARRISDSLLAAGAATVLIGGVSLMGWLFGVHRLAAWKPGTLPMAPLTAVLSMLCGLALGLSDRASQSPRIRGVVLWAIGSVLAISAALLLLRTMGRYLLVEHLGFAISGTVRGAPTGYTSPVAAALFVLAAVAVLADQLPNVPPLRRRMIALGAGMVVLIVGVAFLLANLFGTPLLAGTAIVPLALSSSVTIAIIGLGLLALASRRSEVSSLSPVAVRRSWVPLAWIFIALALTTVIGAYAYYRQEETEVEEDAAQGLEAISELQLQQLTQWRSERVADAQVLMSNAPTKALMASALTAATPASGADELRRLLAGYGAYRQYDAAFLIGRDGITRLSEPRSAGDAPNAIVQKAAEVLRTGQMAFLDFFEDPRDHHAHLATIIPIVDARATLVPAGVLALSINPAATLYSLLGGFSRARGTAETALVRRDGADALTLNNLRFEANSAMHLRVPLSNTSRLSVKAVLGARGVVQGIDYRGKPALATVRAVPESPWLMITCIETAEFHAVLWTRFLSVLAFVLTTLFGVGVTLTLVWRTQIARYYRHQVVVANSMRAQAEQLEHLVRHSPTVLYTLARDGDRLTPVDVSANVERILGYSPAEALEADWWMQHIHTDDRREALASMSVLDAQDHLTHEFRFFRRDGGMLWVRDQVLVTRREAGVPVEVTGAWNDITESREAEDAVRQSEERLQLALRSASQGLWDLNVQTGDAIVSPEYATMLDYDPATFHETRDAWADRIHPDDRKRVLEYIRRYRKGPSPFYQVEFRMRTRTGEWKWLLSQGRMVSRTADGRALRMIGTHMDITARKLAELGSERLKQLYAALSQCYEAVAQAHSEAELFPRICEAVVAVGGHAMAWIGLADDATGLVVKAASHGAGTEYLDGLQVSVHDNPLGRGPIGRSIRENRPCFDVDILHDPTTAPWHERMRSHGWTASAALPLRRNGKAVGALTVYAFSPDAFDEESRILLDEIASGVSYALNGLALEAQRRQAERQLRESEVRYRTLFSEANVPRLVINPGDGAIVDANEAAAQFYGWPLPELLNKSVADINTLGAETISAKLKAAVATGRRRFEFQHRLANGDVRDVLVFSATIALNGQRRLLSTIFDITDRKRDEIILQEALREREELLKEVHHRVKNNLQIISSLLRLESGRQNDQSVKTVLSDMQFRILSMALLHETLYRSGNLARVDLASYLSELSHQLFRSAAPSTGQVTLQLQLESVLVDIDHAIPCGLLVNELLSNALKHAFPSSRPGVVTVRLQRVDGGPQLRLSVGDDGIGLPGDFEVRRASSLGLLLVTGLARQLHGTLEIEPGPGTRFSVAFAPTTAQPVEAA